MEATFEGTRSRYSVSMVALALFGGLTLGMASGYLLKSLEAQPSATIAARSTGSAVLPSRSTSGLPAIDPLTGFPSGGADDLRILATLKQSGYEGGATVAQIVDLLTGYPSGSAEDQRILAILKQSGYEGGATVLQEGR